MMRRLFQNTIHTRNTGWGLLLLRVGGGLMMLTHGMPKLMQFFSDEPVQFVSVLGLNVGLSLALAVFAEVVCSLLVVVGLGTRLAAIPIVITMLTAAFTYHGADPFSAKEPAILYAILFLALVVMGGGRYAVERKIAERLQ